jgi:hypothetical protein
VEQGDNFGKRLAIFVIVGETQYDINRYINDAMHKAVESDMSQVSDGFRWEEIYDGYWDSN